MIHVREHLTDSRIDMLRCGTACGVYLNGKLVAAGPLVDQESMRAKFTHQLATLRRSDLP